MTDLKNMTADKTKVVRLCYARAATDLGSFAHHTDSARRPTAPAPARH